MRPTAVVVALACDTLGAGRRDPPFGVQWVMSGRAAAYVGAAGSIRIEDGLELSELLARRVAAGRDRCIGGLLAGAAADAEDNRHLGARRALAALRLVGDPFAPLPQASRAAASIIA